MLSKDVFVIEDHLLSFTIKLHLLFFHLLSHLVEHLKELVFTLVWGLDVGDWLLWWWGSDILSDMQLAVSKSGNHAPSGVGGSASSRGGIVNDHLFF